MAKLAIFGGVGEVGGNKILVSSGEKGIFLDFGKSFRRYSRYFETITMPPRSISELVELGIIPDIKTFYSGELKKCLREYWNLWFNSYRMAPADFVREAKEIFEERCQWLEELSPIYRTHHSMSMLLVFLFPMPTWIIMGTCRWLLGTQNYA